jgi:hypothetical protein
MTLPYSERVYVLVIKPSGFEIVKRANGYEVEDGALVVTFKYPYEVDPYHQARTTVKAFAPGTWSTAEVKYRDADGR